MSPREKQTRGDGLVERVFNFLLFLDVAQLSLFTFRMTEGRFATVVVAVAVVLMIKSP